MSLDFTTNYYIIVTSYKDRSTSESEQAFTNVQHYMVRKKVTVVNGDGIAPLVMRDLKCDTLMIIGMGVGSTIDVLSSPNNLLKNNGDLRINEDGDQVIQETIRPDVFSFASTNLSYLKSNLGIKR